MKREIFFLLAFLMVCACSTKNGSTFKTLHNDSTTAEKESSLPTDQIRSTAIKPLDTIATTFPNGKGIYLLVLEYYDSLPDKPIKDFEIRNAENNELVFRSIASHLSLTDEVDPFKGEYDSIIMIPTYYISSKDPLTVKLSFILKGNLGLGYLKSLTCDIKYKPNEQTKKYFDFLSYKFILDNQWEVQSMVQFKPCDCNITDKDLLLKFNKIGNEKHLDTEQGDELLLMSFICFINGLNPHYERMIEEYKKIIGISFSPYRYYTYITYFDAFIIDLNFQNY